MRELDEWVAAQLGWERAGDEWRREAGNEVEIALSLPRFTADPHYFARVKREIEWRKWSWYSSWSPHHENSLHYFSIDVGRPGQSRIYTQMAETEELAGCLAFKATVEAQP